MINTGNWIDMPNNTDISRYHGFVYEVEENDTGMKYIGKTSFWRVEKKKPGKYKKNPDGSFLKGKDGKRVLETRTVRKHKRVETDWRNYTTSNALLSKKIQQNPSNYKMRMLYFGTSVMDLKIKEAFVQISYYMDGRWDELYNEQIDLRGRVPKNKN